jgi:hypothetical protein
MGIAENSAKSPSEQHDAQVRGRIAPRTAPMEGELNLLRKNAAHS